VKNARTTGPVKKNGTVVKMAKKVSAAVSATPMKPTGEALLPLQSKLPKKQTFKL
jgi:hypothetical protein